MQHSKTDFPEEEEFVLCTVTAVHTHSVFVTLDEYGGRTGLIHISEIAPGRIRNIREYVKEGKKIVCKVLTVNKEKGHIDLSLRRVNESQKRTKLNQIKQEQLSEKIVEYVARAKKLDPAEVKKTLLSKISAKYQSLFTAFEDVAYGNTTFEKLGIEKELSKDLTEVIKQRIKPPEVQITGDLKISSYAPDGVKVIKEALMQAAAVKGSPTIKYKGAGTFLVDVKSDDYKKAEKIIKEAVDAAINYAKAHKATAEFIRAEK